MGAPGSPNAQRCGAVDRPPCRRVASRAACAEGIQGADAAEGMAVANRGEAGPSRRTHASRVGGRASSRCPAAGGHADCHCRRRASVIHNTAVHAVPWSRRLVHGAHSVCHNRIMWHAIICSVAPAHFLLGGSAVLAILHFGTSLRNVRGWRDGHDQIRCRTSK